LSLFPVVVCHTRVKKEARGGRARRCSTLAPVAVGAAGGPRLPYAFRTRLIVSFSSRVSADLTIYPSEAQLAKSCLNSP